MISKRQFVMGMLVPLLAIQLACHKKQAAQKPTLPGPAQAPTLARNLPDEIQPQPVPENPVEAAAKQEPPPLPKKKSRKPKPSQVPAQTTTPQTPPPQTTVPTTTAELHPPPEAPVSPAAEVAIGPDISSAQAARDRQSTTKLLDTTENQLKHVDSNYLNSDQQSMLTQIRTYISQSRKAINEGDYERASNLAKKAQLLTDELMKK